MRCIGFLLTSLISNYNQTIGLVIVIIIHPNNGFLIHDHRRLTSVVLLFAKPRRLDPPTSIILVISVLADIQNQFAVPCRREYWHLKI